MPGQGPAGLARRGELSEDESTLANFEQYGLAERYPGVMVSDFSISPLLVQPWLDCVITDPPYGIRERMTQTVNT